MSARESMMYNKVSCVKHNSTIENDEIITYWKCPHGQLAWESANSIPGPTRYYWEKDDQVYTDPWPREASDIAVIILLIVLVLPIIIMMMFLVKKQCQVIESREAQGIP